MYLIPSNWLNIIQNVALHLLQLMPNIPLATMCILIAIKRGHKFIITSSYWIRNMIFIWHHHWNFYQKNCYHFQNHFLNKWFNRGLSIISKLLLSYQRLMYETDRKERTNIYQKIGWENYLSCVNFTWLFNVISQFPGLNLDILKEGIILPLSYSVRSCNKSNSVLNSLQKFVNQIDTRTYHDYTIP